MDTQQRPPMMLWLRPAFLIAFDLAAALVLAGIAVSAALESTPQVDEPTFVSLAVGLAIGLPLAVRRRWPGAVLGVVVVAAVLAALTLRWVPTVASGSVYVAVAFAIYPVAERWPRRQAVAALALALGGLAAGVAAGAVAEPLEPWQDTLGVVAGFSMVPIAAWAMGRASGARRAYEARSAERALIDERLRIARDLHDGIAHSLSLITVQAGVANHVAEQRPDEARSALAVIEATSRDALHELRRMLGVLRSSVDTVDGDDAELEPAPTAGKLADLASRASTAGVRVSLDVSGVDDLPPAVGLSVYRIVQESLTNVVKHAAPASCHVRVASGNGAVTVEVTDDGRRTVIGGPEGHGLIGMRERVSLFAGEFAAGPREGGGFRVFARLPAGAAR